jgi:CIC family chloride channel protein
LVGLVVYYFAREAKGHGVPEVMFAVTEKKGIMRPRIVVAKALASALSIGSGGSVGREGPIVQIGSAWGSTFGQLMGVKESHLKLLVACGAAAGIAGTFNAPIGGVLFASEIILGSFAVSNISAIVVSSVLSAAIGRFYIGNVPSFPIPHYNVTGIPVLGLFLVLGIFGGLFSVTYIRTLLFFESRWDRLQRVPEWLKPMLGGIIVGAVGFFLPQILGVGYPTVEKALANEMGLGLLVILLVLKLLITSTTIASGGSGGVFAPGLYMGAMLGGAFGLVCQLIFPNLPVSDGVFAVVGMAAVFAGTAHAPITAMIMLFEMTNNYQLILPLMLATVISTTLSSRLNRESIYTMKLAKRGFDIIRKRASDRLSSILVTEAIHPDKFCLVSSLRVREALQAFRQSSEWFAYVRDDNGRLLGSIAKTQLLEQIAQGNEESVLEQVVPAPPGYIFAHATVGEASRKMNALGAQYLMVVDEHSVPIGIIGSSDIVKAYPLAN